MVKVALCDPYFWEQPSILAGGAWWNRWSRPAKTVCASEVVNEIAAVYLFTFLIGAFVSVLIEYPYGLVVALAAATLYLVPAFLSLFDIQAFQEECESFESKKKPVGVEGNVEEGFTSSTQTVPTARNPFMNVLIDEIKYNPTRPAAADISSPQVADTLDAFFRVQWSSDPTDVFGRTQSQRQFVAQPSTSIPNDQGSYQDWLYRIPGKTCKEGGREACLPGTDGGPVTWLNQDR